jgi:hypothetical protein
MEALLFPFFPAVFLCASSLVFRYRRASIEERQQLKWVAVACALLAVEIVVSEFVRVPDLLFALCLGAIPVSVGIAMLKYRLYDIDVIINRTLIYGLLTSILGLIYASLVVVLQRVTDAVAPRSDLAVAASTLAVAALFRPFEAAFRRSSMAASTGTSTTRRASWSVLRRACAMKSTSITFEGTSYP